MNSKKIKFKNEDGYNISAILEFPAIGKPKHYAIFAHCFTCNKNLNAIRTISRVLSNNQIAVLSFDFTGLGQSEGDFSETNFTSNVKDLISASEFLKENYQEPDLLVGHSLGGAAVLYASSKIENIKAIATIGAPSHPEHIKNLFKEKEEEIEETGITEVNIGGRPFKISKQLLKDIESIDYSFRKKSIQPSLLILHSPQDEIVEIDNAREIYEKARHPKSFISLDGADHLLTKKDDAQYTAEVIAHWSERYLKKFEKEDLKPELQIAVRTYHDSFTTEVSNGRHSIIADEPKDVGGNDFGPTPYDLLLSALGTCTSMTLKMYMDRKEWKYKSIEVHLSHEHRHSDDAKNAENPSGKFDHIKREIFIEGLGEENIQKALEIADKCPVHRSLHSPTKVETKWAKEL